MVRTTRGAILCIAFGALACGGTINFDDQTVSSTPIELSNQYSAEGVTFSSNAGSACTTAFCGFAVNDNTFSGNVVLPTAPNYVQILGNTGVNVSINFANPVTDVSFVLAGLNANLGGAYDGATVTYLDSHGNVLNTINVAPVGLTSTLVHTVWVDYNNSTPISSIQFSKVQVPGLTGDRIFAFDNLSFTTAAAGVDPVPEPASVALVVLGLAMAPFMRRKRKV